MTDFDKAMEFVFRWEGGYVNDPQDPGGETNHGISKKAYPNVDITNLTKEAAKEIYRRDYWIKGKCDRMDWPLNIVQMDCAVNAGIPQASKFLQRALGVDDDGRIGPVTLSAIRDYDADVLAVLAIAEREHFYRILAQKKPQLSKFLNGWLNRCDALKAAIHA